MTSAPAASAARASASVETLAIQAIPFAFRRLTKRSGYSPITEETAAGAASSTASHCAEKSTSAASPAVAATAGPHAARKSRIARSCAGSRSGAGSGIQRFNWNGPSEPARTFAAHAAISAGCIGKAPQAPSPPARITAIDKAGAEAPAIGASRIGSFRPKRAQNCSARDKTEDMLGSVDEARSLFRTQGPLPATLYPA